MGAKPEPFIELKSDNDQMISKQKPILRVLTLIEI